MLREVETCKNNVNVNWKYGNLLSVVPDASTLLSKKPFHSNYVLWCWNKVTRQLHTDYWYDLNDVSYCETKHHADFEMCFHNILFTETEQFSTSMLKQLDIGNAHFFFF